MHHQNFCYIFEIIKTKLISKHNDDLLAGHFGIKKKQELIFWKYLLPSFQGNVKTYIKGYDTCLASQVVKHKLYKDL